MLNPFNQKKAILTGSVTVGLTEIGKRKAEEWDGSGNRFKVFQLLSERGAMTVRDISAELGISMSAVESTLKTMIPVYAHTIRNG